MENKPGNREIALVLASGGIRSVACLPLFEFLNEHHLRIDSIFGTSGGSLMGSGYAMGISPEVFLQKVMTVWKKDLFQHINYRALLGALDLPFGTNERGSGVLKANFIQESLDSFFENNKLEDLKIPTYVHTTDFDTAEGVTLSSGLISKAVYASCADFPFLPPIQINGRWLLDGAFSSPLPIIEAIRLRNPGLIIALMYDNMFDHMPKGILEASFAFSSKVNTMMRKAHLGLSFHVGDCEIILVRVHCKGLIKMWDVHKIPEILEASKACIQEKKEEILHAYSVFHASM